MDVQPLTIGAVSLASTADGHAHGIVMLTAMGSLAGPPGRPHPSDRIPDADRCSDARWSSAISRIMSTGRAVVRKYREGRTQPDAVPDTSVGCWHAGRGGRGGAGMPAWGRTALEERW